MTSGWSMFAGERRNDADDLAADADEFLVARRVRDDRVCERMDAFRRSRAAVRFHWQS